MGKKDKKQVIGEEIGDDKIRLFLDVEPADATPPSLHKLIKAYRGLRVDDFERFVRFFVEAGYDLSAKDAQGHDFIALIQDQRLAEPYIEIVRTARR
ncbi:PA4642 family protein [Azorhizophilus paspali]|uniref:PA4642 family protein n=1 Tax=Azorhizophilus paspali TaxID=69963 RepID=A0ABV6SSE3_AZOPA